MPYGQLDRKQTKALKALVRGKRVHDLGAGDELLAGDLARFGAAEVIAIDEKLCNEGWYRERRPLPKGVIGIKATFEEYAKTVPDIEIAFVSWPANRESHGLLTLVQSARTVVYLGKCTDGVCCGWPGLFKHFLQRELVEHVPDEYNSLFVYGPRLPTPRCGENEEQAGLDWDKIRPYYNEQGGLNAGT